jgi:CheY-like chemotaxis protein
VTAPQKDTATASPHRLQVDTAEDLAAALDVLSHDSYDAILLELPLPDSQGLSALGQLRVRIGTTPIFVCTEHSDEATAIEWLRRGADDYFVKSEVDARWLIRSTRLAVARRTRQYAGIRRESPSKARGFERSSVSSMPSAAERRVQPRYLLTRPIVAIPVLHGSEPDDARCVEGFTVDISTGGIGFEIAGLEHLPTQLLVVGVEGDDEQMHFASVEASHVRPSHIGLRIGGRLITSGRHPLSDDNLLPSMDLTTYRFTTGLPAETLSRWASLGVLQPVLMDRVLACPQCQAIATFRNGCQACGSIQLSSCQLIHHFACAYVGHVQDFECDREIVCPKCRTRALVVGADYEYLNGPYTCLECDWTDTQLELVGQCLRCHYRFPAHQSFEDELIGYHVNRLDPLAFIRSS